MIPISDNQNVDQEASNWTLFVQNGNDFYNLDPSLVHKGRNQLFEHINVTHIAQKLLTIQGKDSNGEGVILKALNQALPSLQNPCDCGLLILCIIEQILKSFIYDYKEHISDINFAKISQQTINQKR